MSEENWLKDFESAKTLLEEALETNKNRLAFQEKSSHGANAIAYAKHLKRQLNSVRKKFDYLSSSLMQLEREGLLSVELIKKHRIALNKLSNDCDYLYDELNGLNLESVGPSPMESVVSSLPSPILQRPPSAPSHLPEDITDLLRRQNQTINQQSNQLNSIMTTASSTKNLAIAMREEITAQNKILEGMNSDVDNIQDKVNVAQRRVKKI
jgi:hypothetical protein